MLEDYRDQQRKKSNRVRSIMDFTMGGFFALLGLYFLTYNTIGINIFNRDPSELDYFLGGLLILYGSWRLYRGYKKNYFQ